MITMLEHQKILLRQVSFDKELFRREIIKSFRWLKSYEIIMLHDWLEKHFGRTHSEVIRDVFEYIPA